MDGRQAAARLALRALAVGSTVSPRHKNKGRKGEDRKQRERTEVDSKIRIHRPLTLEIARIIWVKPRRQSRRQTGGSGVQARPARVCALVCALVVLVASVVEFRRPQGTVNNGDRRGHVLWVEVRW